MQPGYRVSRFWMIVVLAVFVLVTSGALLLYLAYGLTDGPARSASIVGLTDSAHVQLYKDGSARIRAASEDDMYAALGYLHAQQHGWSIALYRRAALGRLSEWFGDDLLELDRLSLRLGLARGARDAYGALPDDRKRMLTAYARGVNGAWARRTAAMRDEFVLLHVEPEQWEPWHALAVERLYAWLAAPHPPTDSLKAAGGAMIDFFKADRFLRQWLHLHGFEHSLAWTLRDSSGVRLFQRQVYGSTALPIFQSVVLDDPVSGRLEGATLVGTPFLPVGKNESRAWAILLSSSLSIQRAVRDTSEVSPVFERLVSADGEEHLLRIERAGRDIFFEDTLPFFVGTDSTMHGLRQGWTLTWSGFVSGTDANAWTDLENGAQPAFSLFEGDGLVLDRSGNSTIVGQPSINRTFSQGSLISNNMWSGYVAERLDSLVSIGGPVDPAALRNDRHSEWAARLAPAMTDAAIAVPNQPAMVTEALAFLRNWDFAYDRASIAASIFDTWVAAYRDSLGVLPTPELADSALTETLVRYELLVTAVERLADEHGDNLSQWRWEDIQKKAFYFPVFSADTLLAAEVDPLPTTRYSTITIPGAGHPTTLFWGPSIIEMETPSASGWESWVSTGAWDAMKVRTRRFQPSRFFGRYLVSDRPPEPFVLGGSNLDRAVVLFPQ